MDEFDEILGRIRAAKSENARAVLSHVPEQIVSANARYRRLLAEYHEIFARHKETVRVKKWMESYERSRRGER